MSEETKGHVKVTLEIELNEEMMGVIKDAIAKAPELMPRMRDMRQNM